MFGVFSRVVLVLGLLHCHYHYYFIIHYCITKTNTDMEMIHVFPSSSCFLAFFWHHGILNISKRLLILFWFSWLFGAWCLVLGFLGLGAFILSFFPGDKYLSHSALDSNCIYSFDFYFFFFFKHLLFRVNLGIVEIHIYMGVHTSWV